MVVGDIVNGIGAAGSDFSFQPAAGVEIAITSTGANGQPTRLTNGITAAIISYTGSSWGTANIKLMINNTNYVIMQNTGDNMCYSGIQLK